MNFFGTVKLNVKRESVHFRPEYLSNTIQNKIEDNVLVKTHVEESTNKKSERIMGPKNKRNSGSQDNHLVEKLVTGCTFPYRRPL